MERKIKERTMFLRDVLQKQIELFELFGIELPGKDVQLKNIEGLNSCLKPINQKEFEAELLLKKVIDVPLKEILVDLDATPIEDLFYQDAFKYTDKRNRIAALVKHTENVLDKTRETLTTFNKNVKRFEPIKFPSENNKSKQILKNLNIDLRNLAIEEEISQISASRSTIPVQPQVVRQITEQQSPMQQIPAQEFSLQQVRQQNLSQNETPLQQNIVESESELQIQRQLLYELLSIEDFEMAGMDYVLERNLERIATEDEMNLGLSKEDVIIPLSRHLSENLNAPANIDSSSSLNLEQVTQNQQINYRNQQKDYMTSARPSRLERVHLPKMIFINRMKPKNIVPLRLNERKKQNITLYYDYNYQFAEILDICNEIPTQAVSVYTATSQSQKTGRSTRSIEKAKQQTPLKAQQKELNQALSLPSEPISTLDEGPLREIPIDEILAIQEDLSANIPTHYKDMTQIRQQSPSIQLPSFVESSYALQQENLSQLPEQIPLQNIHTGIDLTETLHTVPVIEDIDNINNACPARISSFLKRIRSKHPEIDDQTLHVLEKLVELYHANPQNALLNILDIEQKFKPKKQFALVLNCLIVLKCYQIIEIIQNDVGGQITQVKLLVVDV